MATALPATANAPATPPEPAVVEQLGMYHRRTLPESCIAYESAKGIELFKMSFLAGFAWSHFPLVAQFHTQDDPAFCGLGTLAMVLNALDIDPQRVWKGVWRWFDESLLDSCKSLDEVRTGGITIDEFKYLATCNGADATVVRPTDPVGGVGGGGGNGGDPHGRLALPPQQEEAGADEHGRPPLRVGSLEHFRKVVLDHVSQPAGVFKSALVVSYSRQSLKQTGDGHFSPIGAFAFVCCCCL